MDIEPKVSLAESDVQLPQEALLVPSNKPWYQQKFFWMIVFSVVISVVMTAVSLRLYVTSGAAQLDLSRPGYESVRTELDQNDIQTFEGTGVISEETITQFKKLYEEQNKKTRSNQFASKALSNPDLGLPQIPENN